MPSRRATWSSPDGRKARSVEPLRRAGSRVVRVLPAEDARRWRRTCGRRRRRLEPLDPAFVSVTYGAGGSTRERTHATVARIVRETTMKPAAHLTCVGALARRDPRDARAPITDAGVRHIVALRGDPPGGLDAPYEARPDGYQTTAELVADAKAIGDFEVSVGTYPEKHPQSPTLLHDIEILKRKVDAGRGPGDHPVLLRQQRLFPLSRRRRGGRHRRSRSCRESFRCRISSRRPISPAAPGRACRTGSPSGSRASRTTRRRAASSPPPSAPNRSSTSSTTASRNCTSTR